MEKITGNEPAMPVSSDAIKNGGVKIGLSIRQEFAARAMQGLCANSIPGQYHKPEFLAKEAVRYADALITALNTQP